MSSLEARLGDNPNFVWLRRQVDDTVAEAVQAMRLKGVHQVREYRRKYPEGESSAHVVGFTNIDDAGQEGLELAYNSWLGGACAKSNGRLKFVAVLPLRSIAESLKEMKRAKQLGAAAFGSTIATTL